MPYQLYSQESSSNVLASIEMAWLNPAATCLEGGAVENWKVRLHVFSLFAGKTGLSRAFFCVCKALKHVGKGGGVIHPLHGVQKADPWS